MRDGDEVREAVRESYAKRALAVLGGGRSPCCGGDADPVSRDLYAEGETAGLPEAAVRASLGCGNPTALAELRPGETVLDLGSGGGIDVLLSARRVGTEGFVYGLDMTDEMLALAERNRREAGAENVRFLKGTLEAVPLPDASVDVVLSNCVINLSADKGRVLREAFRVLRPGGRFAVSDVVVQGSLPERLRASLAAWAGCVAGALDEDDYRRLLAAAGFGEIEVRVTRVYGPEDLSCGSGPAAPADALAGYDPATGRIASAFVRAAKPAAAPLP
jgi:SAM-dependent methyltransferase